MNPITRQGLTKFGNMTVNGIENCYDGSLSSTSYFQGSPGWTGMTLATPSKIIQADFSCGANGYDASGQTTQVTIKLYAKQGTAPVTMTDGTLLGQLTFTDVNQSPSTKTIGSVDQATLFDHVWATVSTPLWALLSDFQPYTDTPPPPPPPPYVPAEPALQTAQRHHYTRSCDGEFPFPHIEAETDQLRLNVRVNAPAVAKILLHEGVYQRGDITGIDVNTAVGAWLTYRYAANFADLQASQWHYVDHPATGLNIISLTHHYGNIVVQSELLLQAGYYQFSVNNFSGSTAAPTADGLAGMRVSGVGFNKLAVDVDYNAALTQT